MNWFLYDRDLTHEKVKGGSLSQSSALFIPFYHLLTALLQAAPRAPININQFSKRDH